MITCYLARFEMGDFWSVLSVNNDLEGLEFVSTLEANSYPFTATQVRAGGRSWRKRSDLEVGPSFGRPDNRTSTAHKSDNVLGLILFLVQTKP